MFFTNSQIHRAKVLLAYQFQNLIILYEIKIVQGSKEFVDLNHFHLRILRWYSNFLLLKCSKIHSFGAFEILKALVNLILKCLRIFNWDFRLIKINWPCKIIPNIYYLQLIVLLLIFLWMDLHNIQKINQFRKIQKIFHSSLKLNQQLNFDKIFYFFIRLTINCRFLIFSSLCSFT
jgi:hypothetical protein